MQRVLFVEERYQESGINDDASHARTRDSAAGEERAAGPAFSAAAATRLRDCEAVALITADGFVRRGHPVAMKETADEAARAVPSLRHVIVHRHVGRQAPWTEGRDHWWHDLVRSAS